MSKLEIFLKTINTNNEEGVIRLVQQATKTNPNRFVVQLQTKDRYLLPCYAEGDGIISLTDEFYTFAEDLSKLLGITLYWNNTRTVGWFYENKIKEASAA